MKQGSDLAKLLKYAGHYKFFSIASWILSAISAWMALLPFIFLWKMIQEVLQVAPYFSQAEHIVFYGGMAVLFSILSLLIYITALMCSHMAAFRVQANMRSQLMHHIVTLPMGFMDGIGSGKLRKIVEESTAATEAYLAHQLPDQVGAIATPIGLILLLLFFDWRLGLLSLVPVIAAFLVMGVMTGKRMETKMTEYQNALAQMSNEAVEYVRGIPVVKTFNQSVFSFKRFKASIDAYQKWVIAYTKDLRMPMVCYTTIINSVFAVLIAAALLIAADGITESFLLNLMFYIIVTPIITVTLHKIMFSSNNRLIVADALCRIEQIMELQPLPEPVQPQHPKEYSITLKNATFRYPNTERDALHDISLHIAAGKQIAFVGPSGSGKTTLAGILARFWDVTEGTVQIGDVDVRQIHSTDLMNTVSFVFQDSKLLKTSILENVRMARPSATREEVLKALHDAQCDDIIAKLPQGIDTVIGSKGIYLSGGEQQRITIARAMLKNAPILILDEATAFADPDNEQRVQQAFSKLASGKTVIMIAHRLSTIIGVDCIYVLKDGNIYETGTHEQLIQKNDLYAQMWQEYNRAVEWKVGGSRD